MSFCASGNEHLYSVYFRVCKKWPFSHPTSSIERFLQALPTRKGNKMVKTSIRPLLMALFILVGALTGASPANATATSVAPIISVESASVGSFEFNLKGTVLEDVKMSYKGVNTKSKKCHWVNGGWNSGHGIDGRLYWFWDSTRAYICPSKKSPTGWIKVKGGMTGRKCGNPWKPKGKPRGPIVKNVTLVKSFAKLKITVTATAAAKVVGTCPNNPSISGEATASGSVSAVINMTLLVRAKGNATQLRVIVQEELKGQGIAEAKANLKLNCGSPPPPTCEETGTCPPPPCTQNCTSVVILSITDLNDIPTGKSSGPYYVEVSASATGGTLTVDPGIGSITDCNGSPREGSMTLTVPKGVTKFCFVIWAPNDPAKPTEMTVTATAVLGSSFSQKEDVLGITYPTRPE